MRLAAACLLLLLPVQALGQTTPAPPKSGLDLSGSIRLRYETIDGQPRTGFNTSDDLLSVRTILSAITGQ